MTPATQAAEIKALISSAARGGCDEIIPQFERETGHKVIPIYELPPVLMRRVEAGEPYDVLILSYDVEGLVTKGTLAAGSRTVLGRAGVGIAIKQGTPKPNFSTVDAFKRSLLNAKSIATSGEGSSGRYVAGLIERLGIADQVKPKIKSGGPGHSGILLSRGEVDFVVSGLPPLVGVPNVEWLGYLPAEIQSWVVFTGGVGSAAKAPAAGKALLSFLTSPAAVAVWKSKGLEAP